ncbi:MAG: hypothetical protein PHR28_08705 [candidate division Zixibacteria bacterium]|nr:hypothetical protein [candidate division Zixibacteria bacterium]
MKRLGELDTDLTNAVNSPEGLPLPSPPSGLSDWWKMEEDFHSANGATPRQDEAKGKPERETNSGLHILFGTSLTPEEYRESCRNLAEYFALLKEWKSRAKDETNQESSEDPAD